MTILNNRQLTNEIFESAQYGLDLCIHVIQSVWHKMPHPWLWHTQHTAFTAAIQLIGAKLCSMQYPCSPNRPGLIPPVNWQQAIRLALRYTGNWAHVSGGLALMRNTLQGMYSETCKIAGVEE